MKITLGIAAGSMLLLAAGSALADGPYRESIKDAPHHVAANWSGVYIAGGLGYGVLSADETSLNNLGGAALCGICEKQTLGGRGWFGTVGLGVDRQLHQNIVAGLFVDADFGRIDGTLQDVFVQTFPFGGRITHDRSLAVGARGGFLVAPNVLTYATIGYSHAHFTGTNLTVTSQIPLGIVGSVPAFSKGGWFIGSGVEMALHSGWSWKTEYRLADYGSANVTNTYIAGGAPIGITSALSYKPIEQTVRTEVVYKFNWH